MLSWSETSQTSTGSYLEREECEVAKRCVNVKISTQSTENEHLVIPPNPTFSIL